MKKFESFDYIIPFNCEEKKCKNIKEVLSCVKFIIFCTPRAHTNDAKDFTIPLFCIRIVQKEDSLWTKEMLN